MRIIAALGVAVLSACSWTSSTVAHPTLSKTQTPTCKRTAPIADTAIGGGLVGASLVGVGFTTFSDSDPSYPVMLGSLVALGTGIAFLASSFEGNSAHDDCNRELLAMQNPSTPEPLHVVVNQVPASCEQRRLDMYTRAVTGADPEQRAKLLADLPTCASESASREKAWMLAKNASLAASAGKCDEVEPLARKVYELDVALHDVVMLSDIEIKFCLSRREL